MGICVICVEISNNKLIDIICDQLDVLSPSKKPYSSLIRHVSDRPGHDFRYSIDSNFIKEKLDWEPKTKISEGIQKTVRWYLKNIDWIFNSDDKKWSNIQKQTYQILNLDFLLSSKKPTILVLLFDF